MELHDIGWAVRQLEKGNGVYRTGWNGKGQAIYWQEPEPESDMTLPYIYISTVDGERVPWLCSQADLLAEDWEVRS